MKEVKTIRKRDTGFTEGFLRKMEPEHRTRADLGKKGAVSIHSETKEVKTGTGRA